MNLVNRINDFAKTIKSNEIVGFNQKICNIPGLISLTYGEPDFPTPDHIKRAAIKAIQDNESHYTDSRGIESLRKNAAKFLDDKYNLKYNPDTQVIVTVGVAEGLNDVFRTILNPGDEVIIPTPTYSQYTPNILANGGKPVFINVADEDFILTPQRLKETLANHSKTKAIVLNYPNNPIGNTYTEEQLRGLAAVVKEHDIFCVSDEIYSELTYDAPHFSIGTLIPDQTILLNGASKTFAMTGWRIGLVCGPADVIKHINAYHTLTTTSATSNAQFAASEAFGNGQDDAKPMREAYLKRRKILRDGLSEVGFTSPNPSGAFYIFAKIPDQFEQDSFKFGLQLAKEAKVGIIPGAVFGPGGDGHIRFSYAASSEDLKEVVKRVQNFVRTH